MDIAHNFFRTRINYDDHDGYDIDQEVTIVNMLKELGPENARGTRVPVDDSTNDVVENDVMLPVCAIPDEISVRKFRSLIRSLP